MSFCAQLRPQERYRRTTDSLRSRLTANAIRFCYPAPMPNALDSPTLVASLAIMVGIYAQVVARHTNVPGIVLLLAAGVLLGPDVANFI
jgi:hypothetical protein